MTDNGERSYYKVPRNATQGINSHLHQTDLEFCLSIKFNIPLIEFRVQFLSLNQFDFQELVKNKCPMEWFHVIHINNRLSQFPTYNQSSVRQFRQRFGKKCGNINEGIMDE